MVHINDPLLLIGKNSPCSGGSGFPLSLYEWSFTICPTPYNRIKLCCIEGRKVGNVLFNDALYTMFLIYGYMALDIW